MWLFPHIPFTLHTKSRPLILTRNPINIPPSGAATFRSRKGISTMAIFQSNVFYNHPPCRYDGDYRECAIIVGAKWSVGWLTHAPIIATGVAAGIWLPSTNRPNTRFRTPTKWGKYRRVPFSRSGDIVYSDRCNFLYISETATGVRDGAIFYTRGVSARDICETGVG